MADESTQDTDSATSGAASTQDTDTTQGNVDTSDRDGQRDPANLGDAGKRALDAERAARRDAERKLSDLQAKVKEFEDKDKSDQQKLEDRATAAESAKADTEAKLAAVEARLLRYEVAAEKGLTLKHAMRLQGDDREALEKDADEFAKDIRRNGSSGSDFDGGADRGGQGKEPAPGLERLTAAYAARSD